MKSYPVEKCLYTSQISYWRCYWNWNKISCRYGFSNLYRLISSMREHQLISGDHVDFQSLLYLSWDRILHSYSWSFIAKVSLISVRLFVIPKCLKQWKGVPRKTYWRRKTLRVFRRNTSYWSGQKVGRGRSVILPIIALVPWSYLQLRIWKTRPFLPNAFIWAGYD